MNRSFIAIALASVSTLALTAAQAQTPPGLDTSPYILENPLTGAAANTAVDTTNGVPNHLVYSAEGTAYTNAAGTGGNLNKVLVDANGALVACGAGCGAAAPAGDTWVAKGNTDPTQVYQWVPATYANVATAAGASAGAPLAANPNSATVVVAGTYAAGDYVTNAAGKLVIANAANCGTPAQGCTFVAAGSTDTKAGQNLPGDIAANTGLKGRTSATGTSTTFFQGAATYAGPAGSTSIGVGGLVTQDGSGNQTTVAPAGLATTTATGHTVVTGGIIGLTNAANVTLVTANGIITADTSGNQTAIAPAGLITTGIVGATNGTASAGLSGAGFATYATPDGSGPATFSVNASNGNVTTQGTVKAHTVTTTTLNAGTANVGTTNTTNLNVAPGGTVDMGGNVVHDVGTPQVGTDATNKAYVDKGLNKAYEGTALALALSQPIFLPGQTFAVRAGWGDYQGQGAFGVTAAGVVARDVLWNGSTVSLDAGVGVGDRGDVAGKAGATFGFGAAQSYK
jgi:trimeric autotransporter adhesin